MKQTRTAFRSKTRRDESAVGFISKSQHHSGITLKSVQILSHWQSLLLCQKLRSKLSAGSLNPIRFNTFEWRPTKLDTKRQDKTFGYFQELGVFKLWSRTRRNSFHTCWIWEKIKTTPKWRGPKSAATAAAVAIFPRLNSSSKTPMMKVPVPRPSNNNGQAGELLMTDQECLKLVLECH